MAHFLLKCKPEGKIHAEDVRISYLLFDPRVTPELKKSLIRLALGLASWIRGFVVDSRLRSGLESQKIGDRLADWSTCHVFMHEFTTLPSQWSRNPSESIVFQATLKKLLTQN